MTCAGSVPQLASVTSREVWEQITGAPLVIVGVIVGAVILRWLIHRAIRRVVQTSIDRAAAREDRTARLGSLRGIRLLEEAAGFNRERHRQRAATMGGLLRSVTTFVIFTIALLTVMAELGVPLGPLLASAGIGGVALGFGAQALVKDFLSGLFMIVEDQYGVGDIVDTGEATGTVEDVTLRVTRQRDSSGVVWYIRNGEIIRIGNISQGWSTGIVDIPVAYDEDVEHVMSVIRETVHGLQDDEAFQGKLLEEPTPAGVESVSGGTMTLRVFAKCAPNQQWGVVREIRERVKVALDRAGIRGPQLLGPYGDASRST
jgi:small conductance mechanosensitive channel